MDTKLISRTKKAFTLVEILAVMAIIGVLAAISVAGLVFLRSVVELDQATDNIVSIFRTYQNKARNSAISENRFHSTGSVPQSKVDGFGIHFNLSPQYFSIRYCYDTGTGFDCTGFETNQTRPEAYGNVTVTATPGSCKILVFERLTGQVYAMNNQSSSTLITTGVCTIVIRHPLLSTTRELIVDLDADNIRPAN